MVVSKSRQEIAVFRGGREVCRYHVALGRCPVGPKTRAGDHKTPEGTYVLDSKNRSSGFHLVHGIKNGLGWLGRLHRLVNWTDGCIALTNPEMDRFDAMVPIGTPIEIQP